ncbi:MAG: helix-turn-helix domain-containing protein [Bacteroidota bacterium]
MHHTEFESPDGFQDAIKCLWYTKYDAGDDMTDFEVVPDGYAEIIFHFGSGCSVLKDGILQPLPSPFMMGLLNQPAYFYTKKVFSIIGIRCFPWAIFELLGLKPDKDGVRVFNHPIAGLQNPLTEYIAMGDIPGAIALVKQYLLDTRPSTSVDNTLSKAGVAMKHAKGAMPVSEVASAAHATVRTLERKFKQSSGYTVKDVSGLMRFEQVRNILWREPKINLASLANRLGYTDQAHLSREFKRYSGTTPAAFARKTKQWKYVGGNDFVAFIQA